MASYGTLAAMVNRVSLILERGSRLTLVVGSGLTVGAVPGVNAMLDLTESYVSGENNDDLTAALASVKKSSRSLPEIYGKYRQTVNEWLPAPGFDLIVQASVLRAYPKGINRQPWRDVSWREAQELESDLDGWSIPPGVAALAELLARYPDAFGRRVFTCNFDPLLEVAIRRQQSRAITLSLKTDGSFSSVIGDDAIHVVHLHGYWRMADEDDDRPLLHDPHQLTRTRPTLQNELAEFIQSGNACAVGYGGWDDIFMRTLTHVSRVRNLNVMWGFHASAPERLKAESTAVVRRFANASSFVAYKGIDSDVFFPSLLEKARARQEDLRFTAVNMPIQAPSAAQYQALKRSPEESSEILRRLDRLLGWRWDQGSWGSTTEPNIIYWSVRLRRRTVIHAVQARVAASLSAHGVETILCLDDLGVERAADKRDEFVSYIERIFADVHGSTLPTIVSLEEHLSQVETVKDSPLGVQINRLPESPWRVLQNYLAKSSPTIVDVLTVSKIFDFSLEAIDFTLETDRENQLELIRHALERRDGNKLLTPVTLWSHINHVMNNSESKSLVTLGGSDETALWQMWRTIFGRSIGHLFNPKLSNLHQDSGFVRWESGTQLRVNLSRARDLPHWDQSGRLIPWLYINTVLLRSLLDQDRRLPEVAGQEMSSWQTTRSLLVSHKRQALDALTESIADFFEPGMAD